MKLTSIEIHPANSSFVALSFRDPNSLNPFNVRGITGLDVDSIVPQHYGSTGASDFYNLTPPNRTIVIQIGLNPNFKTMSFSDLRDTLYKLIGSSRSGLTQLQFKNGDTAIAVISGFIGKFETTMFDKDQVVTLTINCNTPMLMGLVPTVIDIATLDPSNMVYNDDLSTSPHGISLAFSFNTFVPSITFSDPEDFTWSFEIAPAGGFNPGDILFMSSEVQNKYLYLLLGDEIDVTKQLADSIVPGSVWPMVFPGTNRLAISNPTDISLDYVLFYPTYWGV